MLVFFITHCSFVNLDGITNIFVCCDTVRNNREERLNAFFSFFSFLREPILHLRKMGYNFHAEKIQFTCSYSCRTLGCCRQTNDCYFLFLDSYTISFVKDTRLKRFLKNTNYMINWCMSSFGEQGTLAWGILSFLAYYY